MTYQIDTALDRTFSEPPNVAVSDTRTHCDACGATLDVNVMHKCHGNKHYEPPVVSHTDITEPCPQCETGESVMVEVRVNGAPAHVVICKQCRTYLYPILADKGEAIASWNLQAMSRKKDCWPVWQAAVPGDDERNNVIAQPAAKGRPPDLTNYKGVCPAVHADGEECDLCQNTGEVK